MTAWQSIAGYKTYGLVAVGLVSVFLEVGFGVDVPGVDVDPANWMEYVIGLLGAATLRHGMPK